MIVVLLMGDLILEGAVASVTKVVGDEVVMDEMVV